MTAAANADARHANYKPFGCFWGSEYFTKWATIWYALLSLGLDEGATILDVGAGGGRTTWLHAISPRAGRTSADEGWIERGIGVRALERDCRRAGLTEFRRFYEGASPFPRRLPGLTWQLARLLGAQIQVSPRTSVWLAARRPR